MGKTMYQKLTELIGNLRKETNEISEKELKMAIMQNIGSDARTLKNAAKTLTELNLVKEENDGRIILI